jgi:hypothetical protein
MPYVIKRTPLHTSHEALYLKLHGGGYSYTDSLDHALVFNSHHALLRWAVGNLGYNLGGDELHIVQVKQGGWVEVE